jgi:drug/metabolite transporter (DMT)-like permease
MFEDKTPTKVSHLMAKRSDGRELAQPVLLALAAAALFGAATPVSKLLLASISPFQLAGLLYLGAAVGVLPLLIAEQRSGRPLLLPWRMPPRTRPLLLGAVVLGGVVGPVLLLMGLQLAQAASGSIWKPSPLRSSGIFSFVTGWGAMAGWAPAVSWRRRCC